MSESEAENKPGIRLNIAGLTRGQAAGSQKTTAYMFLPASLVQDGHIVVDTGVEGPHDPPAAPSPSDIYADMSRFLGPVLNDPGASSIPPADLGESPRNQDGQR